MNGSPDRLSQCFDQAELGLDGCPARFSIALPNEALARHYPDFPLAATPGGGRAANGRGIDAESCRQSCMGELAELASCCAWGDESMVSAPTAALGPAAIWPNAICGLSAAQYREREGWNDDYSWLDWRPREYAATLEIDWIRGRDLITAAEKWVPADAVLIGRRESGDEDAVVIADSNGCASGRTLEDAIVNGLCELVERDAVARWWYGRRSRPEIDLSGLDDRGGLISYLMRRERRCRLVDIRSNINIPTFAAVSCAGDGGHVVLGAAAAPDPAKAQMSALVEMLQMELAAQHASAFPELSPAWTSWNRRITIAMAPFSLIEHSDKTLPRAPAGSDDMSACLAEFERLGLSACLIDLTRPSIGIPAVRVVAPELCSWKPRFGKPRLLAHDPFDALPTEARSLNPEYLLV